MGNATVSPVGAVLIVVNWLFAASVLFEYSAVQDLLSGSDGNWQDAYDSGMMAFASMPVTLGVLLPVVAAAVVVAALAIRRVRTTALGWATLAVHLALLLLIWNGPAAPGSAMDYWARLALLAGSAVAGIVAGTSIRPRYR